MTRHGASNRTLALWQRLDRAMTAGAPPARPEPTGKDVGARIMLMILVLMVAGILGWTWFDDTVAHFVIDLGGWDRPELNRDGER